MTQAITMYTTSWCGFCRQLKSGLAKAGIDWTEIDIDSNEDAAVRVMQINGGNQTVPTLEFSDGSSLTNPTVAQVKQKLATLM